MAEALQGFILPLRFNHFCIIRLAFGRSPTQRADAAGFKGLRHSADPFLGLLRLLGAIMSGSRGFPEVDFGGLGGVLGPLGGSWVTWGPSWVAVGVVLGASWGLLGPS